MGAIHFVMRRRVKLSISPKMETSYCCERRYLERRLAQVR
jgi:hypothetical protein